MKDSHYVLIFGAAGLLLALAVSKPRLLQPEMAPPVGSLLRPAGLGLEKTPAETHVYAEGTVTLGSDISAQEAARRVLFIIARAAVNGQPGAGMPVAVKKIDAPVFPLTFSLTNANNMIGTDFYEGNLTLLVRLDADGIAGPKQPDDVETSVDVGPQTTRRVEINLSKKTS